MPIPAPPISPPSGLRRLLRRGYEGQEGYDRQAGPTQWLFQGPPAESKVLAASQQPPFPIMAPRVCWILFYYPGKVR